jgi:hypothetical protein
MTWGWKNGGQHEYYGYYSIVFENYFHMQDSVTAAYEWIAWDLTRDTLVPVGRAWARAKTLDSLVDLWESDNNHPTLKGSYLTACVFYAKLFEANPIGLRYTAGLSRADARFLQTVAYETIYGIAETGPEIPIRMGITAYPNPFRTNTDIRLQMTDISSRNKKLQIFDVSGRLIKSFSLPTTYPLLHTVVWDGTDQMNRTVPPGVYIIQLKVGDKTETAKIVKLK